MTVDMLAAAFIWPEEVLIGRAPAAADHDPRITDRAEPVEGSEAIPLWAALMRRLRADAPSPDAEAR